MSCPLNITKDFLCGEKMTFCHNLVIFRELNEFSGEAFRIFFYLEKKKLKY